MVKDATLYTRLGLEPTVTETDIKKAYNTLSKKWHPDKNLDNHEVATEKFKEITEAKEILLDKEKRALYDQIGMEIFNNNNMQEQGQGGNPFAHFGNMFSGGFPFGNMGNMGSKQNAPENVVEQLNVTLEQLYNQVTVEVKYKCKNNCSKCNGEGVKDGKKSTCSNCKGNGMCAQVIRMGNMIQQVVGPCNSCSGKGKIIQEENKCKGCNGECYMVKEDKVMIPLKSNLKTGSKLHVQGKGNTKGSVTTDLIIVINELPHILFHRYNNDLIINIDLKLYQALFGFNKMITHLDGRKLDINYVGKTDFNTVRKIKNEGMKDVKNKGDLYVRFIVSLPNLLPLPSETKVQIKSLLESFDKYEVSVETKVKELNLTKMGLTDCNQTETESVINILVDLKTIEKDQMNKEKQKHQNNEDEQNVQCNQQ